MVKFLSLSNPRIHRTAIRKRYLQHFEIEDREIWDIVLQAISKLPDRWQPVLTARLNGMLHKEIAVDLGVKRNRAQAMDRDAMKRLAFLLSNLRRSIE